MVVAGHGNESRLAKRYTSGMSRQGSDPVLVYATLSSWASRMRSAWSVAR